MLSLLFTVFIYSAATYGVVKLTDNFVTAYYTEHLRLLKKEYEEEIEDEPELDPLHNVTRELTYYYYKLGISPAWQLICNSYLLYTYYTQFKENIDDYCQDDFYEEEEESGDEEYGDEEDEEYEVEDD